ncbi:MAG: hypothetical protein R3E68_01065 [Burkholderiaceae bacterium]
MNGAEALVRTLLANNLDVCFTNPVRPKCISSPRWTRCPACAACSACSKVW